MSDTKDKLSEARYFLSRMRETQPDRDAFKYNLSAFLSAARSVRWFMHAEYKNVPGFVQWWNSKKEWVGLSKPDGRKTSYEEVLNGINKIRDPVRAANAFFDEVRTIAIHQRSISPRAQHEVKVTTTVGVEARVEGAIIRADGTRGETFSSGSSPTPGPSDGEATIEWRWYFKDLPPAVEEKDVLALSEDHLARLDYFVAECESKFPTPKGHLEDQKPR